MADLSLKSKLALINKGRAKENASLSLKEKLALIARGRQAELEINNPTVFEPGTEPVEPVADQPSPLFAQEVMAAADAPMPGEAPPKKNAPIRPARPASRDVGASQRGPYRSRVSQDPQETAIDRMLGSKI